VSEIAQAASFVVVPWQVVDGEVDVVRGDVTVPRQSVRVVGDQHRLILQCRRRPRVLVQVVDTVQRQRCIERHVINRQTCVLHCSCQTCQVDEQLQHVGPSM